MPGLGAPRPPRRHAWPSPGPVHRRAAQPPATIAAQFPLRTTRQGCREGVQQGSARYLTKSERASRRIVSVFMGKIVAPPPPGASIGIHRPCGLCRLHEMVGGLTIACVRTNGITRSSSCRFMRHELDLQITTHGSGALLPRSQRWSVPAHGAGARLRSSSYPCAQQAQEGRGCP